MPNLLPDYVTVGFDGFTVSQESALLRTDMEAGPPKQARIKSRVMVTRSVVLKVGTKQHYNDFMTWFNTTLKYGADWFTWTDPISGNSQEVRFKGGEITAKALNPHLTHWEINATLENWSATA